MAKAFATQNAFLVAMDAPITARICAAISNLLHEEEQAADSAFGRRVLGWAGNALEDALPLRCAGGFHALHLTDMEPDLTPLYAGEATALADAEKLIGNALERHEAFLLPWLDTPPQTNEAGRSSNFAAALLWLAKQGLPPRFTLNELGSSAGINLMMDRFHFDLAGVTVGPDNATIRIQPDWRGPPPPVCDIEIVSTQGADINPIDLTDQAAAARLTAYIWPENRDRFQRMEAAIAEAHKQPPKLIHADAADFVDAMLAEEQSAGTVRVLMHSIVWQYLPETTQQRITEAMEAAGAQATAEQPLAWIKVETNRETIRHEVKARYWPGGADWTMLGTSHAHGKWVEWDA
ncbi:DUF2332 domain-containing protein [Alterisphingorhabdus coralli]|uniref:DUF2332 domain-containing protein n=1 Tax=Alterisphingorhabdus coralli TaxID=3071408 RepID=A0AA97FA64_9SPHN|nr:DUF2332 domain-containing protein [Parasphingorhabdus sp. SCSIO 66989]WOE75882.1 DUF2332 domain-containing protein [Parasphingorhabdus sp. SCSIO 66989]